MEELRERISEIIFDSQVYKSVDKSREVADIILNLITNKAPVAKLQCSDGLAEHYIVNDGKRLHMIKADNWTCGGNGLEFSREDDKVAWFLTWDWWKRADAC